MQFVLRRLFNRNYIKAHHIIELSNTKRALDGKLNLRVNTNNKNKSFDCIFSQFILNRSGCSARMLKFATSDCVPLKRDVSKSWIHRVYENEYGILRQLCVNMIPKFKYNNITYHISRTVKIWCRPRSHYSNHSMISRHIHILCISVFVYP